MKISSRSAPLLFRQILTQHFMMTNCHKMSDEQRYGTLLHIACCAKNIELVKECLEQGFDINARDLIGRTPFYFTTQISLDAVKLFVENGCDTKIYDINGCNLSKSIHRHEKTQINQYLSNKMLSSSVPISADYSDDSINNIDNHGFTPLIRALFNFQLVNRFDKLIEILQLEVDVNKKSLIGHSPLMMALCENVSIQFLVQLLEKGAVVNSFDKSGNSVFSYAVRCFSSQYTNILIEKGAKVDEFQSEGKPPLIWAVIYGKINAVNYLLSKNANVNQCDGDGNTALAYAAFYDDLDIAKILLQNGAHVDLYDTNKKIGKAPLAWAIIGNKINIIKWLFMNNANIDTKDALGNTLLMTAIRYQRFDILKILIKKNIAIDAVSNDGKTALIWAIINESIKLIQYLIENGASCCKSGKNEKKPLYHAVKSGNIKIIKLLLQNNAKRTIQSALLLSIEMENVEIVELLMKNGGDIKYVSLFKPLRSKNYDLFHLLVRYEANMNEVTESGQTLLDVAIETNQFRMFELLIRKGIDVKKIEASLELAIKMENLKMVNFLLDNNVNPNKAFQNGEFPLKMAAKLFNFDIITSLISSGAMLSVAKDELKEFASIDLDLRHYLENEANSSNPNNDSNTSKLATLELEQKCIKCRIQPVNTVLNDCGHKEMCFGCALNIASKKTENVQLVPKK